MAEILQISHYTDVYHETTNALSNTCHLPWSTGLTTYFTKHATWQHSFYAHTRSHLSSSQAQWLLQQDWWLTVLYMGIPWVMAEFIDIYLSYKLSQFSILEYHTKAFLMIVKAIPCFAHTLRSLRPSPKPTIELIMPNQSQCQSLLNHLPHPFLLAHPKKSISLLTTTSGCVSILMRSTSSLNCTGKLCHRSYSLVGRPSCTIPKFILFSMRYTLHSRCVLITCLQMIFSCFQRLGHSCWA